MRMLPITFVLAQVILVDDVGLKSNPIGLASLESISKDLQNNYGEKVDIIKKIPQNNLLANIPKENQKFLLTRPISRPNVVTNQPISNMKSNFPFNPPLNITRRNTILNFKFKPPGIMNKMPNKIQTYPKVLPKMPIRNNNISNIPQTKEILSPIYFPKNKESIPHQYIQKNNNVEKKDFNIPNTDSTDNELEAKDKNPPVEIEPYNLEMSTPDIDQELDEGIFDNSNSKSNLSSSISPKHSVKPSDTKPNEKSEDIEKFLLSRRKRNSISSKHIPNRKNKTISSPNDSMSQFEEGSDANDKIQKRSKNKTTMTLQKTNINNNSKTKLSSTRAPRTLPIKEEKKEEESRKTEAPKLMSKKFLKKHNENILSADKARKNYIELKISESKEKQNRIEKKLDSLKELEDKFLNKLSKLVSERNEIKQKAINDSNLVENNETAIEALLEDKKKTEQLIKLEEVEIAKLEKALTKEKNKYQLLNDQQSIFNERLENIERKSPSSKIQVKINENKLAEYDKLLKQINEAHTTLKTKIQDMEEERKKELNNQNKLEIEKKEIEDTNHIPLFAIYD